MVVACRWSRQYGRLVQPAEVDAQPVAPAYDAACVTALVPALLHGDLVPGGWPSWLPGEVLGSRRILLLVLDGLGWEQLRSRSAAAPNLAALAGGPITTVAPSTTAAALTSISTGVAPGLHGVVGYRIAVRSEEHTSELQSQ